MDDGTSFGIDREGLKTRDTELREKDSKNNKLGTATSELARLVGMIKTKYSDFQHQILI